MNITEYVANYHNHPVLFIGTGISLRYLSNSYTWDGLLKYVSIELTGSEEFYYDIKDDCFHGGKYKPEMAATRLEQEFNIRLKTDRNGKFKAINDVHYEAMARGVKLSRFKIFLGQVFSTNILREEKRPELLEFKKIRKNIGSVITTNYDSLIEEIFEFTPLIGNDILLSNPYGSVYKVHGCNKKVDKIIITVDDYAIFDDKYELIRAQLLSLFIHNPIIFLGYNVGDDNIKKILRTIFTYVEPNSELAEKIRRNFLLVEFEAGSTNTDITEHDIDIEGMSTIRINKLKTDDYTSLYKALSEIHLPISAMDVRKVQNIVKEIYAGGDIKVSITEDLEDLKNGDTILAIGSSKTIQYQFQTAKEMVSNYFDIIDEANSQILSLIDKYTISENQYFPIFGFTQINANINSAQKLKINQKNNINKFNANLNTSARKVHNTIQGALDDETISATYKMQSVFWNCFNDNIPLEDIQEYLRGIASDSPLPTHFRQVLCLYDFKKYPE